MWVVFGYFQEIGLMYNLNVLDKEMVKKMIIDVSLKCYALAERYVNELQRKYGDAYKEWGKMNEDLKKMDKLPWESAR